MPSVMTTASPIWASTASKTTLWPAFFGFTPPTIAVPEASMRWVCLRPSEPVMPWTMTLLFSLRKIDISAVSCSQWKDPVPLTPRELGASLWTGPRGLGGGELGGPAGGAVHRVHPGHPPAV